jgi:hypothetical protein
VDLAHAYRKVEIGVPKINQAAVVVPHRKFQPAQFINYRIELRNIIQVHVVVRRGETGPRRIGI